MKEYLNDRRMVIEDKILEGAHFKEPRVNDLTVVVSTVVRTTFEGLRIDSGSLGAGMQMSEFIDCTFERCRLQLSVPGRVRFVRCRFVDVQLIHWVCLNAEFIDCWLSGSIKKVVFDASLRPRDQEELGRTHNRYENNDFQKCAFQDVAFRGGIELDPALLPEEPGGIFLPDAVEAYASALKQLEKDKNEDVRKSAGAFLRVRRDNAVRGQRQDYIAPADLRSKDRARNEAYAYVRRLLTPFDPRQ